MTSFQPAAFAASSDRVTRASPIPWLRNTGSTIKGPSSRAETSPIAIGVMAEAAQVRVGGSRLADAIGRARESARAERAVVEAFDRLDVVVRRWLQNER